MGLYKEAKGLKADVESDISKVKGAKKKLLSEISSAKGKIKNAND